MKYTYMPILDMMIDMYQKPRDVQTRFFDTYLKLVQTPDKKDLQRPIPFFNPMWKKHVLEKLQTLQARGFEEEMAKICKELSTNSSKELQVYMNLADDVAGGWTDKDQTHEMSTKIRPFITRWFCVVVFYVSDDITPQLIRERMTFYAGIYEAYQDK